MRNRGMLTLGRLLVLSGWLSALLTSPLMAAPGSLVKPTGEMRWALYVTFPPAWLDPAEVAVAGVTPFWIGLIVAISLVIIFPEIALFLPRLMR
jgi:TRAP-type C4-dicarboxylate transport system permease large subunit